jgi:hypothetical protein
MLLQATLGLDDLTDALQRFTPLEIRLGDLEGKERTLFVEPPSRVTLVPERGLRVETNARLSWTVAGVAVPVTIQAAQLLLLPEIVQKDGRDVLRFQLVLESADLKHVPAFLDAKVVEQVNEALQADDARPTWDFLKTLSFAVALPQRLRSARSFELEARWGAVNVSDTAVVFTVSYDSAVHATAKAS